jgi:pyridoxine 4-dehydrogenase
VTDRGHQTAFDACAADGVRFVPYFPLGSAFRAESLVLGHPALRRTAGRLGVTPAQVALAWLLDRSPAVLLIPGTSSADHLTENLAAADIVLDEEATSVLGDIGAPAG